MKNTLIATMLLAGIAISCNTPKNTSAVNQPLADGKSFETAVVIQEKSETAGVHAEYQWIRDHYSNYKVLGQSLKDHGKKPYDVITIELADGDKRDIYFDISKYFGHY
jgi:hypothetical protein